MVRGPNTAIDVGQIGQALSITRLLKAEVQAGRSLRFDDLLTREIEHLKIILEQRESRHLP